MDLSIIKELRRIRKIKIQDLAKQSGIHRNTMSNIENNRSNPTLEQLESILKCLNLKLAIAFE